MPKVKVKIGSKVKSCLKSCFSHNLRTTEASLMKLHKDKHNKKVNHTQDSDCHAQGQGHCQGLKGKTCFCDYFKTILLNIIKLHRKANLVG